MIAASKRAAYGETLILVIPTESNHETPIEKPNQSLDRRA
jgi:hypothetical protein